MSKVVLNIREVNRNIFNMIKSGKKTIETRAATRKFNKIIVGDSLIFKCGKDRLEKEVLDKHTFKSIDDLLKTLDLKEIMPHLTSAKEAKNVWYSFPKYEEKIEKHGLVAFRMK